MRDTFHTDVLMLDSFGKVARMTWRETSEQKRLTKSALELFRTLSTEDGLNGSGDGGSAIPTEHSTSESQTKSNKRPRRKTGSTMTPDFHYPNSQKTPAKGAVGQPSSAPVLKYYQ